MKVNNFGKHRRHIVYAVVKRYRERGGIENRPRSGRKKKLDDRDTRKLLRLAKNRLLPRIMIVFTSDDKSFDFSIAFVYALFQMTDDVKYDVSL
jgi:transposase